MRSASHYKRLQHCRNTVVVLTRGRRCLPALSPWCSMCLSEPPARLLEFEQGPASSTPLLPAGVHTALDPAPALAPQIRRIQVPFFWVSHPGILSPPPQYQPSSRGLFHPCQITVPSHPPPALQLPSMRKSSKTAWTSAAGRACLTHGVPVIG